MRTAIATVCLSGTLAEKIEAIAAAQFKGVEIFENDLLSFNGTPAEARRMIEDLGLGTITFQPFRDFEGMPEPQRSKAFARAERKFDVMEQLGCDLLMICSNVSPNSLAGNRQGGRGLPRTRRARRKARVARRLRGALLGAAHPRLPRCMGGREASEPSVRRVGARFIPCACSRHGSCGDQLNSPRPYLPRADGGRSEARHGLPLMEPPLPLLSRAGRPCHRRLHARAPRHRIRRSAFA